MAQRKFKFTKISPAELDSFEAPHPLASFFQTSPMTDVSKVNGWNTDYLGVYEGKKLVAVTRLTWRASHGFRYYYAIRGPLLDYHDTALLTFFMTELKKYCRSNKGYQLKIDPQIIHLERDRNGEIVEHGEDNTDIIKSLENVGFKHGGFTVGNPTRSQVRWVSAMKLRVGEVAEWKAGKLKGGQLDQAIAKLLSSFKQNHRTRIHKTERYGIVTRPLRKDELDVYLDILRETGESRHFEVASKAYYEAMYDSFIKTKKAQIIAAFLPKKSLEADIEELKTKLKSYDEAKDIAKIEKTRQEIKDEEALLTQLDKDDMLPLAASLFIQENNEILYFTSGSYRERMKFCGQYAVQWYEMKWGLEHGYDRYNFYGISGIFDPKDPTYGVFDFKKGFGAVVEEYIGDFYMPLSFYYYIDKLVATIKGLKK